MECMALHGLLQKEKTETRRRTLDSRRQRCVKTCFMPQHPSDSAAGLATCLLAVHAGLTVSHLTSLRRCKMVLGASINFWLKLQILQVIIPPSAPITLSVCPTLHCQAAIIVLCITTSMIVLHILLQLFCVSHST